MKEGMDIGEAIGDAKAGKKVFRIGWNGKNMYVVYQKGYPSGIRVNEQTAKAYGVEVGTLMVFNPYLQLKNPDGSVSMWAPSGSDAIATDWCSKD